MKTPISILMVDDEPELLEIITKRLGRRGFSVHTALCCSDALKALRAGPVDVIVLDVMLPDKNGIQCLGEIKELFPDVAVILLTGHASTQTGIESLKLGAIDYCLKPMDIDILSEKIEIAFRGQ